MFKTDMLRPNYLGLITAEARGLGPKAFYPPLNVLGKKRLTELKENRAVKEARYGRKIMYDLPDEDYVKHELYTDAEVEPPYYRATE